MSMQVAVGHAFSVEGREAVARAVYKARLVLGNVRIHFAVVIASFEYDFESVYNAAQTQIGDVPMIGFSTSGEFDTKGNHRRSVVVALITDDDLEVKTDWVPGFSENSVRVTNNLLRDLGLTSKEQGLLLMVADGIHGNYEAMANTLPVGRYQLAGGLSAGDIRLERTYQMGGGKFGTGGLAGAFLSGNHVRIGVGNGLGWLPVGAQFRLTDVNGLSVRGLNNKSAIEGYAEMFGRQPRDWAFPPLNTLVRLYPLGIDQGGQSMMVRTPLRIDADGSLRMHTAIPRDSIAQLLIGSREQCLAAARQAASGALAKLDGVQPKLALVFADVSWQMMFQGYEGVEIDAIREVLGEDVPLVGGYTFGQFRQTEGSPRAEFLNQYVQVVVIGEE